MGIESRGFNKSEADPLLFISNLFVFLYIFISVHFGPGHS